MGTLYLENMAQGNGFEIGEKQFNTTIPEKYREINFSVSHLFRIKKRVFK